MSNFEKYDLGRPSDGSTFSTTLHLLSPRLQAWIRSTSDRKQLRRLACACARKLFGQCPQVPTIAIQTVELAERFCADQASEQELEASYATLTRGVQEASNHFRAIQQALDEDRATLDEHLAADLACRAALASRACVLRSAPVAAAEGVFEYSTVIARRKRHDVQILFLARADQLLDQHSIWHIEEQGELLQSYLRDLPRPFAVRFQKASDAALRHFACACAAEVIEDTRKRVAKLGQTVDLVPLVRVVDVSRRHADSQGTPEELQGVYEAGLQLAREWYRKEEDLADRAPRSPEARCAGLVAEMADSVYVCAEESARLAAVKSLQVALHALAVTEPEAIFPLAEQFLGAPPPDNLTEPE